MLPANYRGYKKSCKFRLEPKVELDEEKKGDFSGRDLTEIEKAGYWKLSLAKKEIRNILQAGTGYCDTKMKTTVKNIEITDVQFLGHWAMLLSLSNERTLMIPLNKFEAIANLTNEQRKDFEIIDGENLSFLSIDEVYSMQELTGIY